MSWRRTGKRWIETQRFEDLRSRFRRSHRTEAGLSGYSLRNKMSPRATATLPSRSIQHQPSSMPSTPRKRPKPHSKSTHSPSSSSSLNALMEPPENFFPSKPELFKLLAVIAIATSVAALCNYVVTILSRHSKPFCDTNADSQYLPSDSAVFDIVNGRVEVTWNLASLAHFLIVSQLVWAQGWEAATDASGFWEQYIKLEIRKMAVLL
ncbi:hypothetical protein CK203_026705 [Vitis vinifera]|uniref:Uncharacterized protein n=1 Tax=Vitis vinifera TaxID=29760 RepID=A0A438IU47_VITVI|nr:hypothetical protein CK203_026705 [Vitis vinifera]